jgi:hypothetical protein
MEEIPIGDGEVELVFFSQSLHHALHPERALAEAARILVARRPHHVLDLRSTALRRRASFMPTSGSASVKRSSNRCCKAAGFVNVEAAVVDKEPDSPAVSDAAGRRGKEEVRSRSESRRSNDGANRCDDPPNHT